MPVIVRPRRVPLPRAALVAACTALLSLGACAGYGGFQDQRTQLQARFKAADTNGDEELSREEMQKGFPDLAPHFDDIDQDHNGKVNFAELWSWVQYQNFARQDARYRSPPR